MTLDIFNRKIRYFVNTVIFKIQQIYQFYTFFSKILIVLFFYFYLHCINLKVDIFVCLSSSWIIACMDQTIIVLVGTLQWCLWRQSWMWFLWCGSVALKMRNRFFTGFQLCHIKPEQNILTSTVYCICLLYNKMHIKSELLFLFVCLLGCLLWCFFVCCWFFFQTMVPIIRGQPAHRYYSAYAGIISDKMFSALWL